MEIVFQWVKNITWYVIMVHFISILIPGDKYGKYIKLFAGMLFILILIQPLLSGLGIERQMAYAFEQIRFQTDTQEFSQKIWGIEEAQLGNILNRYEEAIAADIVQMAKSEDLFCTDVAVEIESREQEERFGQVTGISMVFGREQPPESAPENGREPIAVNIEAVKPIDDISPAAQDQGTTRQERVVKQKEQEAFYGFQRKVAGYYGLEESAVRISWEDD